MAKATDKVRIILDNGEPAEAQAPVIVSASRSTDIPAFYCDWFFERLRRGYSAWTNPFNGVTSYVSYQRTRFIVFWSKNPRPLLKHLNELRSRHINCYVQYTLNDYEREHLERGVPPLEERIETFKSLVDALGKGSVIWRFDPMILTDQISMDDLLAKVCKIGDSLRGYTEKLVFSYADIAGYRKVKSNLEKNGIRYREWTDREMDEFARCLSEMNRERGWNYTLATCGEKIDTSRYGISHNRCVDDELMIRLASDDEKLMEYLKVDIRHIGAPSLSLFDDCVSNEEIPDGAIRLTSDTYAVKRRNNKDKGQRQFCECTVSKDIGQYNTCPHLCEYCYANSSKEAAITNWKRHNQNPVGDRIIG